MTIVAGGDSFIWGIDLPDQKHSGLSGHSQLTWPAQLAKDFDQEYVCAAKPGGSNDDVTRRVIEQCELVDNPIVIVQWTFPWRFGFRCVDPIGWFSFDLQVVTEQYRDNWTGQEIKRLEQNGVLDFARSFFKSIGTTEYWPVYNTLKEILLLQSYLKSKNIPYLFTAADNCLFENSTIKTPTDIYVKQLYDQIDFNKWYWFPAGTAANETCSPRGFYQWALENKYNVGATGHPLEQAHVDAMQLIKEKFNEMVIKHN